MNDIDLMLKEGITAAKAGNKALAYPLLLEATKRDPESELAWLWLAGVSKSPQEAQEYLRKALVINPDNKRAQAGLKWAEAQVSESVRDDPALEATDEEYLWMCPYCQTSSTQEIDECIACGARLTLDDIDALISNSDVDHKRLGQAITQLKNSLAASRDFDNLYALGIAYLNLSQVETGLTLLKEACSLREDDVDLAVNVAEIASRLHARRDIAEEEGKTETIMVVDDSPTICRLVTITLERRGYQVITASDGFEAMAKLNDGLPDMILLDITMPRMDGYQLCKTIKGNPETEPIPVIMLSGKDGFIDKVRSRMVGSDDYITKPFEPAMLLQYVSKYLNRSSEVSG